MTSGLSLYSALSLVRQRIHAVRQFTRLSEKNFTLSRGYWEMTSRSSPDSALSLVQQWIHVYVSL